MTKLGDEVAAVERSGTWRGFGSPFDGGFTWVPNLVLDRFLSELSGVELKVVLYLCRWRFGMSWVIGGLKRADFQRGVVVDGAQADQGVGESDAAIDEALHRLKDRGLVVATTDGWWSLRMAAGSEVDERALDDPPPHATTKRRAGGTQRLRVVVFARDQGVCARCRFDAVAEERELDELAERKDTDGLLARLDALRGRRFNTHFNGSRRSLWELDHIVAVVDGGSDDLENLRTLCTPCHKSETATLLRRLNRGRLSRRRRRAAA